MLFSITIYAVFNWGCFSLT